MNIKLKRLEEKDINELTPIIKRSFDEDSKLHLGQPEGGPEGYDNGEFLRKFGLDKASTSFKILLDDKIIGAVITCIDDIAQDNFLGNIFLDPRNQNRGIGEWVWRLIEKEFPKTKIWRTETPGFATRNHYFYVTKCGFKIVRIEDPKDKYMCNYIMEKEMK